MTIVKVRPARPGDEDQVQGIMNDAKNLKWLGGWTQIAEIKGRIAKQTETGEVTLMVVERDGVVVSSCEITPKAGVFKMGLVAVKPEYRDFEKTDKSEAKRQGYGSSMYTLHALRAALEGRCVLLDQIHWLNDVMKEYLPSLGFEGPVSEMRQRARNFCSLSFYEYDLVEKGVGPWIEKARSFRERGYEISLQDHATYEKNFNDLCTKVGGAVGPEAVEKLKENREEVLRFIEEIS